MAVITETDMSNSMSTGAAHPADFADPAVLERVYRKATWRLIRFVCRRAWSIAEENP